MTDLVAYFLNNIELDINKDCPVLSKVYLDGESGFVMEGIKQFVFISQVKSSRVQVVEYRGYEMVKKIFNTLSDDKQKAYELLPSDYKLIYEINHKNEQSRKRVVCDFISGMTDKYAVEFYSRLFGENPQSFFKNL